MVISKGLRGGSPKSLANRIHNIEKRLRTPVDKLKHPTRLPPYVEHQLGTMIRARESTQSPYTKNEIKREAQRLERAFRFDLDPSKQLRFSNDFVDRLIKVEGLKTVKSERKSIKRVVAEDQPGLQMWYVDEGNERGLTVDPSSGEVTGEDAFKICGNFDETLCIVEPTSSQKESVDGE